MPKIIFTKDLKDNPFFSYSKGEQLEILDFSKEKQLFIQDLFFADPECIEGDLAALFLHQPQ